MTLHFNYHLCSCLGDNKSVGLSTSVVSRWLWPGNRTFSEVASMMVARWIVAVSPSVAYKTVVNAILTGLYNNNAPSRMIRSSIGLAAFKTCETKKTKNKTFTHIFMSQLGHITIFHHIVKHKSNNCFPIHLTLLSESYNAILNALGSHKVSMLTHTSQHKPLRKIEGAISKHQTDSQLYVWPKVWSGDLQV